MGPLLDCSLLSPFARIGRMDVLRHWPDLATIPSVLVEIRKSGLGDLIRGVEAAVKVLSQVA